MEVNGNEDRNILCRKLDTNTMWKPEHETIKRLYEYHMSKFELFKNKKDNTCMSHTAPQNFS